MVAAVPTCLSAALTLVRPTCFLFIGGYAFACIIALASTQCTAILARLVGGFESDITHYTAHYAPCCYAALPTCHGVIPSQRVDTLPIHFLFLLPFFGPGFIPRPFRRPSFDVPGFGFPPIELHRFRI